jgi:transcriptional regulator with AAA-type ATPase domain
MRPMAVLGQVLGESEPIAAVREQVARLLRSAGAARRLPAVLILGETGTGKGLPVSAVSAVSAVIERRACRAPARRPSVRRAP